jgi:small subunit ribosomal protein S17
MSIFSKKNESKKVENKVEAKTTRPKVLSGVVTSTKMKDTIVVKVDRFIKAPKYERFVKISKKYKAHDAGNTKKEGDKVEIVEVAPISKDKHFKVL